MKICIDTKEQAALYAVLVSISPTRVPVPCGFGYDVTVMLGRSEAETLTTLTGRLVAALAEPPSRDVSCGRCGKTWADHDPALLPESGCIGG
jgi:hypothetical protein